MKSNFKIFAVAIAAIMTIGSVTLVSCDKDTENTSVNPSAAVNYKGGSYVGPQNTKNPFDKDGETHNTILDSCRSSILNDYNLTGVWHATPISNNILYGYGYDTTGNYLLTTGILDDYPYLYSNVIANSGNSAEAKAFIKGLLAKLYSMAYTGVSDYKEYKDTIVAAENMLLNSTAFSAAEKDRLLSATAVLRYSQYYWATGNHMGIQPKSDKLPWWGKVIIVAGADVLGGVVGKDLGSAISASAKALEAIDEIEKQAPADTTGNHSNSN